MRGKVLSAVVGLLAARTVFAETPPAADTPSITEPELVSRLGGHPRLDQAQAGVDAARAEETAAGVLPNPEISYLREEVFPEAGSATDQFALLSWTIDLSGRRGKRVAAARAGARAAEAGAEGTRLEILLDALDAYYEAAYQRARVAVLREGRNGLAEAAEAMRKRAAAGDAAGYDADRLALELAQLDDLTAEVEIDATHAEHALARAAGGTEPRLAAADPLTLPPDPPALATLLEGATDARADLRAARLRAAQAAEEAGAAGRGWIPSLILTGGLKTVELGDERATGYVAAIAIDLPIFDRLQGDRGRAAAARRLAEAQARLLEREIPSSIREAHAALLLRLAQARAHAEKQTLAEDLVRRATTAYREGERPIIELVDAYRTARDTRLRGLDLIRKARSAEADLWRALGRRP